MKTPRLALFAFLALALAPAARAAYPTWPIIEEGSRSWPEVRFSVGGKPRALQCRYSECNPKAPKGLINLYLLTKKGPGVPTMVTIYKGVERSKWNPRRYTDGEYDYVPEKIAAMAYPYESELSNFKLDTTGAALAVVQGKERYPATTDIDERQFNSYDQMKVAPPKKTLDDEIKPAAPAPAKTSWWCDQKTGDIIGVPAGQKPPAGYTHLDSRSSTCGKKPAGPSRPGRTLAKLPTAGKWKDAVTPVGEWRSIQTSVYPVLGLPLPTPTMTFYCYHEKMDGDKDLATHLKKHPIIVECVNWSAPADDATKEEGGKKFKVRHNHVQFDLGFTNGKLQTLSGVKGVRVTEKPLADALGGEKFVKVTAPQAAPAAGASIALLEEEKRWLTKVQAGAYSDERAKAADDAARKVVDDKYRTLIEAQIRPEGLAAYKAARAAAAAEVAAKTKEAAGKPEMWGGKDAKDVKAVIAPFQETASPDTAKMLEIQLSKAEWDRLDEKRDVRLAYVGSRQRADGLASNGRDFDPAKVDPIALRLAVTDVRKAVGSAETTTPAKDPRTILTPAEIALLTPEELRIYKGFLERATKDGKLDPTDNNLLTNAELLRNRMNNEVPPRSKAPAAPSSDDMTAEQFAKLPLFQQRQFCKDYPPDPVTAQGDTRAPTIDTENPDALKGAENSAPDATTKPKPAETPAKDTAWPRKARQDACAKLPPEIPGQIDGSAGTGGKAPVTTTVPPLGKEAENPEKEKSKWLTSDLLTSAAKGAMVGLLVGSLFGPAGLVLGPLLGGAMFYGLTKITS